MLNLEAAIKERMDSLQITRIRTVRVTVRWKYQVSGELSLACPPETDFVNSPTACLTYILFRFRLFQHLNNTLSFVCNKLPLSSRQQQIQTQTLAFSFPPRLLIYLTSRIAKFLRQSQECYSQENTFTCVLGERLERESVNSIDEN
jgi:hypothetical protein